LYVTAVVVNYLWEVPQMALYEWWGASWGSWSASSRRWAMGFWSSPCTASAPPPGDRRQEWSTRAW
ncbi:MAG: hypothetical protein ACE5JL_03195, partial [Dehalococcoidia bacterium]